MSIRWVKNVLIDGAKSSLEIQIGDKRIGDKCYTRINNELESWFENMSDDRDEIIDSGIEILQKRLAGKKVTTPEGPDFDWSL